MQLAYHRSHGHAERRLAPRWQPTLGTVCRLAHPSGEGAGTGLVWNISLGGVSMLIGQRFEPGTRLEARLVASEEKFALARTLVVAHVARIQTGDFVLGGQFAAPLSTDEMMPFLA